MPTIKIGTANTALTIRYIDFFLISIRPVPQNILIHKCVLPPIKFHGFDFLPAIKFCRAKVGLKDEPGWPAILPPLTGGWFVLRD